MARGEKKELEWEWMSACALHPLGEKTWHVSGRPQLSQARTLHSVGVCACVCVEGWETNAKEISVVSKAPFGVNIMGEGEWCVEVDGSGGVKGGKTLIKSKSVSLDINTPLFFDVMAAATLSATWYIMHRTAQTPLTSIPSIASWRPHILMFSLALSPTLSHTHTHTLWGLISTSIPYLEALKFRAW